MSLCLRQRAPWFLWPFALLLDLAGALVCFGGRVAVVVLGLASMIVGALATVTVIGAPVGVPLFVVGLMLAVRGIF
jgi:hypothetical protein